MNLFKADKYKAELLELATELGIEDVSENDLISTFVANYDFYKTILERSLSDGIISVDEKVELYKYRASIVTDDLRLVSKQDKLSRADAQILTKILHLVDKMREDEERFASLV